MKIRLLTTITLFLNLVSTSTVWAKVSDEEAKALGTTLTTLGANPAANDDNTIPAWLAGNANEAMSAQPYGDEKPVLIIDSTNLAEHQHKLSQGQIALLKKYPDSFRIPVYPTHRDFRFSELTEQRTRWNATKTDLVNGIDGLQNYTGGAPFPIPKDAAEVMWNSRIIHPTPTLVGTMDDIAVFRGDTRQMRRQLYFGEFPFSYADNKVGTTDEAISIDAAFVHVTIEEPKRQKGQMTVVHEALDQVKNKRKAWVYLPGSRRVRRAPTVGYDTPDGPGGLVTVDDSLGFNGAMDRYDWKLVGKQEVYIPYHNYRFDQHDIDYKQLLLEGHANPEYMRYELHRVWVVEATLKPDARHVYAKRRFYIDEDNWQVALLESYDGRGDLWRVGILNTVYDTDIQGYIARAQMFHDLDSGAYIAMRLINETGAMNYQATPKGKNYYSPNNLRKLGR